MNTKDGRIKVDPSEHPTIITRYQAGETCKQIAASYRMSVSGIQIILHKNGIKPRTPTQTRSRHFTINEDYFASVDTEEKAYFLGFLYADGCNVEERGVIQMQLQARDSYILERLNHAIGSNRTLKFYKRETESHQDKYLLRITCKKLSEDLCKLGCHARKSLTLKFPTQEQVPPHLLHHFVRGYFDGDGTIYEKRDVFQYRVSMCVSDDFGQSFKEVIEKLFGMHVSIVYKKNNKIREAVISGGSQMPIIMEWMYKDATIYLKRKYEKWQRLKEHLSGYQTPASSCYVGVSYMKANKKFTAYFHKDKKRFYLGLFESEIEAAKAYNKGIIEMGLNRRLNVV
jgi:LAGLIDADG DNA endonuclease family protein